MNDRSTAKLTMIKPCFCTGLLARDCPPFAKEAQVSKRCEDPKKCKWYRWLCAKTGSASHTYYADQVLAAGAIHPATAEMAIVYFALFYSSLVIDDHEDFCLLKTTHSRRWLTNACEARCFPHEWGKGLFSTYDSAI